MLNENENTTTLETFIEYNMKMKRTSSVVARRLAKKNKAREMEVEEEEEEEEGEGEEEGPLRCASMKP